jgi:hypothetical protein
MRMRRFRLATMMAGVAVLAFALTCLAFVRRRETFRERFRYHASEQLKAQWAHLGAMNTPGSQPEADRLLRMLHYHDALRQKYHDAMSRPWLSVAPDPPEPR